jgi:hypothetical protein
MTKPTLGSLIDQLSTLRAARLALEEQVKVMKQDEGRLEDEFIALADEQGTTAAAGKLAKASITESIVPQVNDWDALYKFIQRKKYWHLLERRPSSASYRELLEQGVKVPGTVPFTKRKLNLRTT